MVGPAWASNPDSPITVARQRAPRRYQQRHRGRQSNASMIDSEFFIDNSAKKTGKLASVNLPSL